MESTGYIEPFDRTLVLFAPEAQAISLGIPREPEPEAILAEGLQLVPSLPSKTNFTDECEMFDHGSP
jgi:hypothetical protein